MDLGSSLQYSQDYKTSKICLSHRKVQRLFCEINSSLRGSAAWQLQRNVLEKQYKRINQDALGSERVIFICSTVFKFQIWGNLHLSTTKVKNKEKNCTLICFIQLVLKKLVQLKIKGTTFPNKTTSAVQFMRTGKHSCVAFSFLTAFPLLFYFSFFVSYLISTEA